MKVCNECGSYVIAPQDYRQQITSDGTEDLNGTSGIYVYTFDTCMTCGSTNIGYTEELGLTLPKIEFIPTYKEVDVNTKKFKTYEILKMIDENPEDMIGKIFRQVGGLLQDGHEMFEDYQITQYHSIIGFGSLRYSKIRTTINGFEEWIEIF